MEKVDNYFFLVLRHLLIVIGKLIICYCIARFYRPCFRENKPKTGARIYRPSFHENKPKTLVFT